MVTKGEIARFEQFLLLSTCYHGLLAPIDAFWCWTREKFLITSNFPFVTRFSILFNMFTVIYRGLANFRCFQRCLLQFDVVKRKFYQMLVWLNGKMQWSSRSDCAQNPHLHLCQSPTSYFVALLENIGFGNI